MELEGWTAVWIVVSICLISGLSFGAGLWSGKAIGRDKGFDEGWEDGCEHTTKELLKEFNSDPNPFRTNMLNAQRTSMPRPDSAGPMRVHTARIRGDSRLPENNPAKREPIRPRQPWRAQPTDPVDSD